MDSPGLKLIKKANYLSDKVLKIFKFCSLQNKFFVFKTCIRPILEYNIILYFPRQKQLQSILENVDKRFTKYISQGISYSQRLELLYDMSIKKRYLYSISSLIQGRSQRGAGGGGGAGPP